MSANAEEHSEKCRRALEHREEFWAQEAQKVVWTKKWDKIVDDSCEPFTRWFVGGELNLCYNCLDRQVENGDGNLEAIIFDSPVSQTYKKYTYAEILYQVSRLAGALRDLGVSKGDMVMIYMPIIPEGGFAMLACARIGAVHVCIPSGLTALDLTPRIDHSKPKVIVMSSHGYHPGGWLDYKVGMDAACHAADHKPNKILVFHREHMSARVSMKEGRDVDMEVAMGSAVPVSPVPMEANEPQFLVYTSGSTGKPKAIVHSVGNVTVRGYSDAPNFFGEWRSGQVIFSTTYLGWIVGHMLVVYAPLLRKVASVYFEGDPLLTDDVRTVYRTLSTNRVTRSFIRPGILKVLKAKDGENKVSKEFQFDSLKHVFLGGERMDSNTVAWVAKTFGVRVWNMFGQTEICCGIMGAPSEEPGPEVADFCTPFLGWDFHVIKADGKKAKPHERGRLLIRAPFPPGLMLTIFGDDELCRKTYFTEYPGYYDTKDEGCRNEDGQFRVDNRADDMMKVGQIYIASQVLEQVVQGHPAVQDCVVVSTPDLVWKELPIALYTAKPGCEHKQDSVDQEIRRLVGDKFGASLNFGGTVRVKELPLTVMGKVHRPFCKALVRGQSHQGIGGIQNPHVLRDIEMRLEEANLTKNALLD